MKLGPLTHDRTDQFPLLFSTEDPKGEEDNLGKIGKWKCKFRIATLLFEKKSSSSPLHEFVIIFHLFLELLRTVHCPNKSS